MAAEDRTKLATSRMPNVTTLNDDQTRIETADSGYPSRPVYQREGPSTGAPLPSRQALQIGDMLKNRFQITDKLGEGGMGMVYKAIDLRKIEAKSHNPYIAIKVLHPDLAQNETLVAGLQRECEKAQQLSHPNIITVFDFDRDGDYVFMSMELLSGQPLNQLIRETAAAGGIKLHRAWPIISQMGRALAYAHRKGIVHSDFKPGNVFVTDDDEVKVLDFGIAAKTGLGTDPDATVFNARAEGGLTLPYASFEMINGAHADPRDDIYAFGLVVYEILSGKHPYGRKPASNVFIAQQGNSNKFAPAAIKGLSRRQWQALKSAIELLQDKRPKSLDAWLEEFKPQGGLSTFQWSVGTAFAIALFAGAFFVKDRFDDEPKKPIEKPSTRQQTESATSSVKEQPIKEPQTDTQIAATTPSTSPPVSYEPPVAQAGNDRQGRIGQSIQLDGSASQSGDGQALNYAWRLLQAPAGSQAELQQADSATPQLTPDAAGEYQAELTVRDGHNSSLPATVRLTVAPPPKPPLSHQASSKDGILSLAASKPKYRIGEKLKLNIHVAQAGYLRVAYIGSTGDITEILPNQNQSSKVKADSTLQIPPRGAKFDLEVTGPTGKDKILAVYSKSAIRNLEEIADSDGNITDPSLQNGNYALIQYTVINK